MKTRETLKLLWAGVMICWSIGVLPGYIFPLAASEIVVRQDQNGNLYITNTPSRDFLNVKSTSIYRKKSQEVTDVRSSSIVIPSRYLDKIRTWSIKYNVDEQLVIAVARAESGFNPHAVSRKGAVGIMQLMVDTARQYGVENRYNADQNIEAGVKHLKYLYNKYNGDLPLILAAYNAGEDAVKKYRGIPPYKETREYVYRVMKYMGKTYSGYTTSTAGSKIYQYRTKDGQIMITDTFPSNAEGEVTVIE